MKNFYIESSTPQILEIILSKLLPFSLYHNYEDLFDNLRIYDYQNTLNLINWSVDIRNFYRNGVNYRFANNVKWIVKNGSVIIKLPLTEFEILKGWLGYNEKRNIYRLYFDLNEPNYCFWCSLANVLISNFHWRVQLWMDDKEINSGMLLAMSAVVLAEHPSLVNDYESKRYWK